MKLYFIQFSMVFWGDRDDRVADTVGNYVNQVTKTELTNIREGSLNNYPI